MIKLFVGIPTINRADLLHESLDDLATNLPDLYQLCIIDNGGQDISVPNSLKDITTIIRPKHNLGVAGSWNYLIDKFFNSNGDHLLILNDDIVLTKTSSDLKKIVETHKNYSVIYSKLGWCSFFISQKAIDAVGYFDTTFYPAYFEDNDYIYRLKLSGAFPVIDEGCNPSIYRGSMTIQKDQSLNRDFYALREHYNKKWGGPPGEETYASPFGGVNKRFHDLCNSQSDINEHLQTLKNLASEVNHVTEFGVRHGVSTIALIMGEPSILRSYDIDKKDDDASSLIIYAKEKGIDFKFDEEDTLKLEIDRTELLFIDTWHVYQQLIAELETHHSKVSKYIVMHDTTSFELTGEDGKSKGLWIAVEEFISHHNEWSIFKRYTNNNGLTILIKNES
jgi:cephalosporin hydroxylase